MNINDPFFDDERIRRGCERNKRGIHSEQEAIMGFYSMEEYNEVLGILRLELGRQYDNLAVDQRIKGDYVERWYYLPDDSECVFDEEGDCVGHKEIKNYLAHGYFPILPKLNKEDEKRDVDCG